MIVFLDTDVLVDYLRGAPTAKAWMVSAGAEPLQVPGIVAMELVIGCRDKRQLRQLRSVLSSVDVVWPESAEMLQAFELLSTIRLKHGRNDDPRRDHRRNGPEPECQAIHIQHAPF